MKAQVVACRLAGLTDLSVPTESAANIRGIGTDPVTSRRFVLEIGRHGVAWDFQSFEIAPGMFPDGDAPWDLEWMIGSQDSVHGFRASVRDGDSVYWNKAVSALLSLGGVVDEMASNAAQYAAYATAQRLSGLCGPEVLDGHQELADVEEAFRVFTEACLPRLTRCQWMSITWLADYNDGNGYLPNIWFGLGRGTAHPVTYGFADAELNLNGVLTYPENLEPVLEHEYADPWARIGARQAAQDLLSIEGPATRLMRAHYEHILADLEKERSGFRYAEFLGLPDASHKFQDFERSTKNTIVTRCREMETRIDDFFTRASYGKLEVAGPSLS